MKALILCVMRLVFLRGEGQLEREGKDGWREMWWEGGKNQEMTFAEWSKERGRNPAEEWWIEKKKRMEGGRTGMEWPRWKQISRPWRGLPAMIVPLREHSQSQPMETHRMHSTNLRFMLIFAFCETPPHKSNSYNYFERNSWFSCKFLLYKV